MIVGEQGPVGIVVVYPGQWKKHHTWITPTRLEKWNRQRSPSIEGAAEKLIDLLRQKVLKGGQQVYEGLCGPTRR
jgi:hypothetical protein